MSEGEWAVSDGRGGLLGWVGGARIQDILDNLKSPSHPRSLSYLGPGYHVTLCAYVRVCVYVCIWNLYCVTSDKNVGRRTKQA